MSLSFSLVLNPARVRYKGSKVKARGGLIRYNNPFAYCFTTSIKLLASDGCLQIYPFLSVPVA